MKRHLLAVLWVGLFLVGCMTQVSLMPGGAPGDLNGVTISHFVKPQVYGKAQWQPDLAGAGQMAVSLAPLYDPLAVQPGFRVQALPATAIVAVRAQITATDIVTPIVSTSGHTIAVAGGMIPPLTFSNVPQGSGRVLSVEGLDIGGNTVHGVRIGSVFNVGAGAAAFVVSPRATPAGGGFRNLTAPVAPPRP
ncbi:MAG: hypothetical protein H7338_01540, partial [Candidatus Sericytochromatia bacterium]|nr:hypothetical protein [Candidatus Sericytochromatia bacterium]